MHLHPEKHLRTEDLGMLDAAVNMIGTLISMNALVALDGTNNNI